MIQSYSDELWRSDSWLSEILPGGCAVSEVSPSDRAAIRRRPGGWPIMYQVWDQLLFLHWPVDVKELRRLVPLGLEIDTWQGQAWIGVTPFTISGVRPPLTPAVPILSTSHEINVRTYVHRDGIPGVWFLSLDASNPLAVWGARVGYSLPYFRAAMQLHTADNQVDYRSVRNERGAMPAEFQARWKRGPRLPEAEPDSLEFFLIERYCLYSSDGDHLYRARIHHSPWPLCEAEVSHLRSSMVESHGVPVMEGKPRVHAQASPLKVEIWPPERVGRADDVPLGEPA